MATASAPLPLSLQQASAQLVPPIPYVHVLPSCFTPVPSLISRLYRRLLRVHRYLTPEFRYMGDSYIKSEFRLTRKTDNPLHIIAFLSQWKQYLDELESTTKEARKTGEEIQWSGRKLDVDNLDKLNAEQVGQLYELMHATKDVWKS